MDLRNRRLQRVVPAAPVVVEPAALRCPITHELFRVPVTTEVGHAYERAAVLEWWQHAGGPPYRDPLTNQPLQSTVLVPSWNLRRQVCRGVERGRPTLTSHLVDQSVSPAPLSGE